MARPIKPRTEKQWKEERRKIVRIKKAIKLAKVHDVALTAELVSRLDGFLLVFRLWIESNESEERSPSDHSASRPKIRET